MLVVTVLKIIPLSDTVGQDYSGSSYTLVGSKAGHNLTTGDYNTIIGSDDLQ